MAGRGPQTFKKRQKEQQRKEKQQEKMQKRQMRKQNKEEPATDEQEAPPSEDLTGLNGPDVESSSLAARSQ